MLDPLCRNFKSCLKHQQIMCQLVLHIKQQCAYTFSVHQWRNCAAKVIPAFDHFLFNHAAYNKIEVIIHAR